MNVTKRLDSESALGRRRLALLLGAVFPVFLAGCPTTTPDPDPDDNGTTPPDGSETVSAQIIGYTSNVSLSAGDPPISVLYSVTGTPESLSGFFVPVENSSPDAIEIGDRVAVSTDLRVSGESLQFQFDPTASGGGFFRVGLSLTVNGQVQTTQSTGVIEVQSLPVPSFVQPAEAVTEVVAGAPVVVTFDTGVPVGDIHWRLFYFSPGDSRSDSPELLGTTIDTGDGTTGAGFFLSDGLPAGEYEIGVSVTDSGLSIEDTVLFGQLDRIITLPSDTVSSPKIQVVDAP